MPVVQYGKEELRVRIASSLMLLWAIAPALPAADFAKGLAAYQKGDFPAAAKEWRPEAEDGDARTQFNLGLLYLDGKGVPQDPGEAAKWFRRSAEQGYTEAQHNLGAMYGTGQGVRRDYVEAYKWMNICAASGNAGCIAQRDLLAKKMKQADVSRAQRMATEFTPRKENEK
jgi:uncharacterized protein